MKPFEYNWTTKHRVLQPGDIVAIKDCRDYKSVSIVRPGIDFPKMSKAFKILRISHGFRVKKLIGPAQHTIEYLADNINNISNK